MEITEAFRILDLSIDSNKEIIINRFKELSLKFHPDKGGNNESMSELINAKELALEFVSNKFLVKVIREVSRIDNLEIQKSISLNNEVNVIFKKAQRRIRNKLKIKKAFTGYIGLISGILTILTSKIVPFFKAFENSNISTLLLIMSVFLGIYFIMLSQKVKILEDNIEDFRDSLNDKEDLHVLLIQIFKQQHSSEIIDKSELYSLVENWALNRSLRPRRTITDIILSTNISPQQICHLIGVKDFSKMIVLKGEESKFIESIETTYGDSHFEIEYKFL